MDTSHGLARFFEVSVLFHCGKECPASQRAIDELSEEFGRGRRHFLDVLTRLDDARLCDLISVAWAKADLKRASGRSRDEWLHIFQGNLKEGRQK